MKLNSPLSLKLFRHSPLAARLAIIVALASALGWACSWSAPENSVRFSGYTERFLSRLPNYKRFSVTDSYDWNATQNRAKEIEAQWQTISRLEQTGQWDKLRQGLNQYLKDTTLADSVDSEAGIDQTRRNSAYDRLDALIALAQGAKAESVQIYLQARTAYDNEKWEEAKNLLDSLAQERALHDNIAYLRAAISYKGENYQEARDLFQDNLRRYPNSEKREANLYMASLSALRALGPPQGQGGGEGIASTREGQPALSEIHEPEQVEAQATPETEDDRQARKSAQGFQQLLKAYPQGRFTDDGRGWLAYLWLNRGEKVKALAEYYRLLASPNLDAQIEATRSLGMVRGDATNEELAQVENELADESAAALAYAYHTLYNYAPALGNYYDDDERYLYQSVSSSSDSRDGEDRSERRTANRQRIVEFATRLLQRYPNTAAGGGFTLRIGMAQMELGHLREALTLAKRALQMGVSGAERARALMLRGAAEQQLKDHKAARRTLTTLLQEKPDERLTERARRTLAMAAEDDGDLGAALEQYVALGYEDDVAYFVDVLMTPEQLAAFVKSHSNHEKHEMLLYSLGVRYLRAGRWDEARQTLAQVKDERGYFNWDGGAYGYSSAPATRAHNPYESVKLDPKDGPCYYEECQKLPPKLILRDIKTATDLQQWEKAVAAAPDDETKAETLYQEASYIYQSSTLLFYNPVVWNTGRQWLFPQIDDSNAYRRAGETAILWQNSLEHETPARALALYLKVVEQYPHTKAARDALYSAAVCHERLSDYNPYWREMYGRGFHAGSRIVTYQDVKLAYPDYRLPRGTWGWEPATRTVNGGPGWDAPPKPGPKPTQYAVWRVRLQKARALLAENFNWVFGGWRVEAVPRLTSLWTGVMSWLVYLLTLLAAYAVARHALPLHRALRAYRLRWPVRASVWRRLCNLSAGPQAAWHCRQWLTIPLGADTPPQSWITVSAAQFGAARCWWTALSKQARRNLCNVVATDALLSLLLLRLLGII